MQIISCSNCAFRILKSGCTQNVFPYLRDNDGDKEMCCLTPLHGRSFVVGRTEEGRYVVSKGNGLGYTKNAFLHTGEFYNGTWGLLLRQDAERDFIMGQEIKSLGIKTNEMHYVIELDVDVNLPNGNVIKPVLLQYDVECPYRICDAPFMEQEQIEEEIKKWEQFNKCGYDKYHMIAADVLIRNLRILHDNDILHNAIHEQNYTWALELLDFELACSPAYPYSTEDEQRYAKDLFSREIVQTYIIINYIAGVLHEMIDFALIDKVFNDYGFDIQRYEVLPEYNVECNNRVKLNHGK